MSIEQILLIAFLVVLPLIQYVMRLARQRNESPKEAEGLPRPMQRPPIQEQQPAMPQTARIAAVAMTAPAQRANAPADPPPGRKAQRGGAVVGFGDLRRGIVLITLIGPCRATNPHAWPDSGGQR